MPGGTKSQKKHHCAKKLSKRLKKSKTIQAGLKQRHNFQPPGLAAAHQSSIHMLGKLGQYVTYFHATFLGVTGNDAQIGNLARQLGAAYQVAFTPGMA